jgi:hypothetical protein
VLQQNERGMPMVNARPMNSDAASDRQTAERSATGGTLLPCMLLMQSGFDQLKTDAKCSEDQRVLSCGMR